MDRTLTRVSRSKSNSSGVRRDFYAMQRKPSLLQKTHSAWYSIQTNIESSPVAKWIIHIHRFRSVSNKLNRAATLLRNVIYCTIGESTPRSVLLDTSPENSSPSYTNSIRNNHEKCKKILPCFVSNVSDYARVGLG